MCGLGRYLWNALRALPAAPAAPPPCRPTSIRDTDDVPTVQPEHRPGLVPLLVRLLYPKMRKRSGRLGGKGESGVFCLWRVDLRRLRLPLQGFWLPCAGRQ